VISQMRPANVTDSIEYCMGSLDGKHGSAFCTRGALPANCPGKGSARDEAEGFDRRRLEQLDRERHLSLHSEPYFTDGYPDEIDLKEAEGFGREMVERSQRETHLIPALPKGREHDEIYTGSGPRCTHCMNSCPTNSIQFSLLPLIIGNSCVRRFLCGQTCP
jgi:hypothetical protein